MIDEQVESAIEAAVYVPNTEIPHKNNRQQSARWDEVATKLLLCPKDCVVAFDFSDKKSAQLFSVNLRNYMTGKKPMRPKAAAASRGTRVFAWVISPEEKQ